MSNKKKTTRVPLARHQTALPDNQREACTEQFIRLGRSLLEHKAVHSLPANAFRLLIYMQLAAGSRSSFKLFPAHVRGMSKQTFYDSVKVLEECGFVTVVRMRMPGSTNNYTFFKSWSDIKPWCSRKLR